MSLTNRLLFTPSWTFFAKYYYPLVTRYFNSDDLVFINFGYEEDPPMALPLEASDEPDRYFIQLYHRTATQAGDLKGKRCWRLVVAGTAAEPHTWCAPLTRPPTPGWT
jgi:hypothetical protein